MTENTYRLVKTVLLGVLVVGILWLVQLHRQHLEVYRQHAENGRYVLAKFDPSKVSYGDGTTRYIYGKVIDTRTGEMKIVGGDHE